MSEAILRALRDARQQAAAGAGAVIDVMLRSGTLPDDLRRQLHAETGVVWLEGNAQPDFSLWSKDLAVQTRCAIVRRPDDRTFIAAEDPWDELLLQRVNRTVGASLPAAAVTRERLGGWLHDDVTARSAQAAMTEPLNADGPVVHFVDQALRTAYRDGASDVHFECDGVGVSVKHRLDGVLIPFARMDGQTRAEEVVSRIKVLAKLDITEKRLPQDGRLRFETNSSSLDVRVSIMPSVHGEDAVLRLLDKAQMRGESRAVNLDALGFEPVDADRIRELALLPSGMLLVTGPTGSGKTTTVYATLAEIQTGQEKIVTIEDPVEYELPGVLQIPVNERKGLSFARGLRSILRHDPDRILVGEIRDAETADIAVQSALTGHLVFSTVHANSVGDIVGRFRHFGIDMFGFMSALNGIVVQRLVRRLCVHCRREDLATAEERAWLRAASVIELKCLSHPVGCGVCHGTGYRGRFVVAEVHALDDHFRDMVTEGATLSALKAHATASGVVPLIARAAEFLAQGVTALAEVKRVIGK